MRVLFSVLTPTYIKNFESAIRLFAARGHEVELLFHSPPELDTGELVESLLREPGVSLVDAQEADGSARSFKRAAMVRSSLDYLRFLEPRFASASAYRTRAKSVPSGIRRAARLPLLRTTAGRRFLRSALLAADRMARPNAALVGFLERQQPDVVLLTPYIVRWDTAQPELLRAARSLGLPTGVCVGSWDHLTSKSSICPQPDRVFVWNEVQRREAHDLHGIAPERVIVTGAQCFDQWFNWYPSPRAEFCSRAGLDPARPYLLYTCSAPLKRRSPPEVDLVLSWLRAVRSDDDPRVASAGVLVRPHPKRTEIWNGVDLGHENAVVFPLEPEFPTDDETKSDYFDSIYHSVAVVGLNTSAMLEAGLIGRPVLTILAPELRASQKDLLHFGYLLEVGGGLVHAAEELDEHIGLLRRLFGPDGAAWGRENGPFVQEFLRPHGLDREATPILVDEIERLAAGKTSGPPARRRPVSERVSHNRPRIAR
jgi:hypothetical protein